MENALAAFTSAQIPKAVKIVTALFLITAPNGTMFTSGERP